MRLIRAASALFYGCILLAAPLADARLEAASDHQIHMESPGAGTHSSHNEFQCQLCRVLELSSERSHRVEIDLGELHFGQMEGWIPRLLVSRLKGAKSPRAPPYA